jgi:hypothetical protein
MKMKEHGILFSGAMVRALLDGCKTQTRRSVAMPPSWDCIVYADFGNGWWPYRSDDGESPSYDNNEIPLRCPYGQPGDRLWVRETWQHSNFPYGPYDANCDVFYRADYLDDPHGPDGEKSPEGRYRSWKPSIHMPRMASRILLEIVSVRVERLQDISDDDCLAEGIRAIRHEGDGIYYHYEHTHADPGNWCDADTAYQALWESVNGAGSWDANPWVWVVEFKRITP